jgi:CheY-like chemotaxis protein
MAESPTAAPRARKLVVVEDDADVREMELLLLAAEGYDVLGLPDGESAAETIERERADLVLLDLMMPRKDGEAVLAELASRPGTASIPVIVVSAYAGNAHTRHALEAWPQVKRIIEKPMEFTVLLDAIARVLASSTFGD